MADLRLSTNVMLVACFCLDLVTLCSNSTYHLGPLLEYNSGIINKYFPHKANGNYYGLIQWVNNQQHKHKRLIIVDESI